MPDDPAVGDELYELDPAEFVAARNALATQLRAAGDREAAKVVAALRRPPAARGLGVLGAGNRPSRRPERLNGSGVAVAPGGGGARHSSAGDDGASGGARLTS